MVDQDLLLEKINQIQNCLKRIHDSTGLQKSNLDNFDTQDIFVLNLQRAVQSTIDLAAHIVADENLGLPENLRDHFQLLANAKIISLPLAENLKKMVGFRNIAVHDYSAINPDILKAILQNHLVDFEEFNTQILKALKK